MTILQDGFGGYLTLILAGVLANEVRRLLGDAAGSRLDLDGQTIQWVRAEALAQVAGLASRMVLFPAGALADVPLTIRLAAFAGGIALYFLARRNLGFGVLGGGVLLLAAQLAWP
jgi:hypothetical protein